MTVATADERHGLRAIQLMRPENDEDLWHWVKVILGVEIPRYACCSAHTPPFEAFADAYFARSSVSIWHASRGLGGKSFLLALLALTEAISLAAAVSLLGGSGEQSERVHAYMTGDHPNARQKFWDAPAAPRFLIGSDPTKRTSELVNGGEIKALTASQRSVRGPHPHRLRLDEIDEMPLDIFDAAMGQPMGDYERGIAPQTVASSTHHHSDGTMTEAMRRASEKGWGVHQWCYKCNLKEHGGWLDPREIEHKRRQVSDAMFRIEYDLQEPEPGSRAIMPEAVEALFERRLGKFEGKPREEIVVIEPDRRRSFYHGADWARDVDWTVLHTMEAVTEGPDRLAAWMRTGRLPWPQMIGAFNGRVKAYGGASAHDETGIGKVISDYLEVDSFGFDFSAKKKRDDMLSAYIASIENGEMIYPFIRYAHGEHKYATIASVYGRDHLPDTISAGALSHRARQLKQVSTDPSDYAVHA